MSKVRLAALPSLVLLLLLTIGCEGYSQSGVKTSSYQNMQGGGLEARINKANGTSVQDIEIDGYPGGVLDAGVTLTVEKGVFKIELLGEDDEATLTLEARDGQTASGQGQMLIDSFGDASYRVTATEAEGIGYTIEYTYR